MSSKGVPRGKAKALAEAARAVKTVTESFMTLC